MSRKVVNVYEPWMLYDTVLIGTGKSSYPGWYESFATLGAASSVPFFNQRNQAQTHPAYNNFDSQEHLSFVFHCYSLGIEFFGMPFSDWGAWNVDHYDPVDYGENYAKFCSEVVQHSGFVLKVGQDEKAVLNSTAAPSGGGITGVTNRLYAQLAVGEVLGTFQNLINGSPHISNRFKFKTPIKMPRAVNVEGKLVFSEYARYLLQLMAGPGTFTSQNIDAATDFNSIAGIRVSMFGKREVQQRGEQFFIPKGI
jgi:hypothetical protein